MRKPPLLSATSLVVPFTPPLITAWGYRGELLRLVQLAKGLRPDNPDQHAD